MYTGGTHQKNRLNATFTHNEDFVIGLDEVGHAALIWDTRTGDVVQRLTGHNNVIRWIAASPVEPSLLTCR
jgi:cleavage stimulation factor subunit 1